MVVLLGDVVHSVLVAVLLLLVLLILDCLIAGGDQDHAVQAVEAVEAVEEAEEEVCLVDLLVYLVVAEGDGPWYKVFKMR